MSFLDPVFNPLLSLPPLLGILILSFVITVITTIIYKFTTNQKEMKKLRKEMKEGQEQLKKAAKDDPKKAMAIQKKVMEKNFSYMKHSFRSMLFTFIPIILLFGWLNTHMSYEPLRPDVEFNVLGEFDKYLVSNASIESAPELTLISDAEVPIVEGKALWTLSGGVGTYTLTFKEDKHIYTKKIVISDAWEYENPVQPVRDSVSIKKIIIGNKPIHPFGSWFNLFGWYPGWLFTYLASSILFSTLLRKILDLA